MHYLSRESLRSFYQMKGIAVISTLIMSVALLMLTLFTLLTVNLQAVAQVFQGEIEVVAFLHDGHSPDEIQDMQQRLLQDSGVASVSFVSKAATRPSNAAARSRRSLYRTANSRSATPM